GRTAGLCAAVRALPLVAVFLVACPAPVGPGGDDSGSGPVTCSACLSNSDCPSQAVCVQYAGGDYCGHECSGGGDCQSGETCLTTSAADGTQVMVCVPSSGTCGQTGCGTCAAGTTCDPIVGACMGSGAG